MFSGIVSPESSDELIFVRENGDGTFFLRWLENIELNPDLEPAILKEETLDEFELWLYYSIDGDNLEGYRA